MDQKEVPYHRDYYRRNPEKMRANQRRYRKRHRKRLRKDRIAKYWKSPDAERRRASEYYRKHRDAERIKHWLNGYGHSRGFLRGSGICLTCGEPDPFLLENHHIFGGDSLLISTCANCHHILHKNVPLKLLEERLSTWLSND